MRAYVLTSGGVKAAVARIQADLHEAGESDSAVCLYQLPELLFERRVQGVSLKGPCLPVARVATAQKHPNAKVTTLALATCASTATVNAIPVGSMAFDAIGDSGYIGQSRKPVKFI